MIKDYLDEKLHEECGVFGVYRRDADLDVVGTTYYGLYALQHRGQESCGMAVNDDGVFYKRRELGLVNDVFTKDVLETMPRGNMCIGHCRYATTGVPVRSNAQPFVIRHIKGPMALAHNGNLTNSAELRSEFELSGAIFHSTSDTEVIAYAITRERLSSDSIEQAVEQTMDRLKGAYSLVVMSPRKLIAARDPQGFRPLCIGKLGENDIIASESCAITAAGGEFVRDVEPGEIVVFDENGCRSIRTHCGCPTGLCVFEYVYIARPDSVVDGASVRPGAPASRRVSGAGAPCAGGRRHRRAGFGPGRGAGLFPAERHPLRHRLFEEQIHRPNVHPAQPEAAGEHRAHQAEPHCGHREGPARGAGG